MLKLKLQYFSHVMQRIDTFEKILMLGKTEAWMKRGQQKIRCLDGITNSTDTSFCTLRETVKDTEAWCVATHM